MGRGKKRWRMSLKTSKQSLWRPASRASWSRISCWGSSDFESSASSKAGQYRGWHFQLSTVSKLHKFNNVHKALRKTYLRSPLAGHRTKLRERSKGRESLQNLQQNGALQQGMGSCGSRSKSLLRCCQCSWLSNNKFGNVGDCNSWNITGIYHTSFQTDPGPYYRRILKFPRIKIEFRIIDRPHRLGNDC